MHWIINFHPVSIIITIIIISYICHPLREATLLLDATHIVTLLTRQVTVCIHYKRQQKRLPANASLEEKIIRPVQKTGKAAYHKIVVSTSSFQYNFFNIIFVTKNGSIWYPILQLVCHSNSSVSHLEYPITLQQHRK